MDIIDNTTLIISVVLFLVVLFASFMTPFLRKPKICASAVTDSSDTSNTESTDEMQGSTINTDKKEEPFAHLTPTNTPCPPISIIFTPHNNAEELERNLITYLNQDYPVPFEIIVVASKEDTQTEDILKRYKDRRGLYTTFIPESSRYMSRKKLAITLGVKAAKNEWLMIADIASSPSSDQWLKAMGRHCSEKRNLIVGYTRYDDETPDFRRFERLHTDFYLMREDQHGKAYRCNSNALMFRKSDFTKQEGFKGNLKYLRGEYDFMVNKYASKSSLVLENSQEGTLTEITPTDKEWRNKKLFYMENRKHLNRSFRHQLLPAIDQLSTYLALFAIIGAAIYSALTHNWIIAGTAGLSFLLLPTMRTIIGRKAIHAFGEDIAAWKIFPYELRIIWHHLHFRLKYLQADKYDFISHKL